MAAAPADITTDYLVVGAGFAGLGFVDELLTRSEATVTIVDKRDAPSGHWNDAYRFVKLHAPATFYGVESKELSDRQIEENGPNKGFLRLSSGPEIVAYCHNLMKDRFLPSGRVTYLPSTEYVEKEGIVRGVHSGKRYTIDIKKRLVVANYFSNNIPLTHQRSFSTASSVTCVPPNDLPALATKFKNITVLGGGKTGIDTCMWLLTNGVDPDRIRWIMPNDYWYINRAKVQNTPQFFNVTFTAVAQRFEALAQAENARDVGFRMEKSGWWHRLDEQVEPTCYHAATVSKGEIVELRKIRDVVRLGHVTAIETDKLVLTRGTLPAKGNTLYVDCTASAFPNRPKVPIFQPGKIVVQIVRSPLIALSGSLIALIDTFDMTDEERNRLIRPVTFGKTVHDSVKEAASDIQNRYHLNQHPVISQWLKNSRLDGFTSLAASAGDDKEKLMILKRMQEALKAAAQNLPKLLASGDGAARL